MSHLESASLFNDQAAGLRQWADEHTHTAEVESWQVEPRHSDRVLMVVGLPGNDPGPVQRVLSDWSERGLGWVGDPSGWRVVPMAANDRHLTVLASQQHRWALWVEPGTNAFRQAYRQLKLLRQHQGPSCLLLMHDGIASRRGMLNNLQTAASSFLGIRLMILEKTLGAGAGQGE